jgi:serine/threonine protein kinase
VNLIKYGHSGDLYKGISESGIPVVIKKIDLQSHRKEAYLLELDFFSKVSNPRLVPLLGHCLEKENEKFLIYKHMPNGDLSSSLYRKTNSEDGLKSLDWITRLKIAIGAAEGLSYLHHECTPPIVHRYSEDTLLIVALFTFLFVISFCCQSQ